MIQICGEEVFEIGWKEGFKCTLPPHGDDVPHRDEPSMICDNTGTSITGRAYAWTFEWRYTD